MIISYGKFINADRKTLIDMLDNYFYEKTKHISRFKSHTPKRKFNFKTEKK